MEKVETIELKVVTPNGVVYESEVEKVTVPTKSGEITVHPQHAPLVSILEPGEIIAKKEGEDSYEVAMAISTGIVEVRPSNKIYLIADTAERATEIDVERAEKARKRAKELLEKKRKEDAADFSQLKARIQKETARVQVGKKYKNV